MPSGPSAGRVFDALRIGKTLTTLAGAIVTISTGSRLNVTGTIRITPRSAAPTGSDAVEGVLYLDSDDHKLYVHNGTTWVTVGSQT